MPPFRRDQRLHSLADRVAHRICSHFKKPDLTADKGIRDGYGLRLAETMGASLASSRVGYWPGRARRRAALILGVTLGLLWTLSTGSAQTIKAMGERRVISRVDVTFPKLAQQMRLRGTVKVSATVAPTGKVVKTELIGGSPIFVPYALSAVSLMKWEPGPKETQETVEIDFVPSLR
jgi:hypothetical protein